jgi:hypothetical protein
MQWTLKHPTDRTSTATYGADEQGHPWASLECNGVLVRYDATEQGYDFETPVRGLLWFMAQFDFFSGDDVADAFQWLDSGDHGWPGRRRARRRGVRRVLTIIERLRMAGG